VLDAKQKIARDGFGNWISTGTPADNFACDTIDEMRALNPDLMPVYYK